MERVDTTPGGHGISAGFDDPDEPEAQAIPTKPASEPVGVSCKLQKLDPGSGLQKGQGGLQRWPCVGAAGRDVIKLW